MNPFFMELKKPFLLLLSSFLSLGQGIILCILLLARILKKLLVSSKEWHYI